MTNLKFVPIRGIRILYNHTGEFNQRYYLIQHFTKGSSFENIPGDGSEAVMHKLKHRPRKILNFKIPHETFFAEQEQETV